jgi:hypothetical protein
MFSVSDCGVLGSGKVGGAKVGLAQLATTTSQLGSMAVFEVPSQRTSVTVTLANDSGKNQYIPLERLTFRIDTEPTRGLDPVIVTECTGLLGGGGQEAESTPWSLTDMLSSGAGARLDHCAIVHDVPLTVAFTEAVTDSLTVHCQPSGPVPEPLPDNMY